MSIEEKRSYQEQERVKRERQLELAPHLSRTMALAKDVYFELRPKAEHVGDVPMSYPLRHQQVHGLAVVPGLGMYPLADYLMVVLQTINANRKHSLVIYRDDSRPSAGQLWDVDRTLQTDDLMSQNTKVKETDRRLRNTAHLIDLEVSTISYRPEYGHNPVIGEFVCSMFNEWQNAENHIHEMDQALQRALEEHS